VIRAEKGGPLSWAWSRYVDWRLARDFHAVWLSGEWPEGDQPLLLYANHASWWDGFAAWRLTTAHGFDGYCVMEEHNLRRWPFLRRLGAFSIRRGDPRSTMETLRYAAKLLRRPRTAVLVFPQGVLDANAAPPFTLERGVEVLARMSNARCQALAIRPAFLGDEKPELFLELGEPHPPAELATFTRWLNALPLLRDRVPTSRGSRDLSRRFPSGRRSTPTPTADTPHRPPAPT
jgi:1-acyl-sn-glycerol-3-phosphate acyltransferase